MVNQSTPDNDCEHIPGASPGTRWRACHLSGTLLSQRPSRIYLTSVVARADKIIVNEGTSPQEARHSKYWVEWSTKQISSWPLISPRPAVQLWAARLNHRFRTTDQPNPTVAAVVRPMRISTISYGLDISHFPRISYCESSSTIHFMRNHTEPIFHGL